MSRTPPDVNSFSRDFPRNDHVTTDRAGNTQPLTGRIQFARITSDNCAMAKEFSRDAEGELHSTARAHMTEGSAKVIGVDNVAQLADVLSALTSNQAITCGTPVGGDTALTTRVRTAFRADAVARTNEAFAYPIGAALFPIDVDVKDNRFRSVEQVLDALEQASPWLKQAKRVAVPSSSSYVDGRGLRGIHVYLAVTSGTCIPALGKRIQIEQWANGYGQIDVSKSGVRLTRQLSDALIYQASRLMFEAAPILGAGVERNVPEEQAFIVREPDTLGRPANYRTNGMLDVAAMPKLRDIEVRRFERDVQQAKAAHRLEAKQQAIQWHTEQRRRRGLDTRDGERYGLMAVRALDARALPSDWELALLPDEYVKVSDILLHSNQYLGRTCADPFDSWRPDLKSKHCNKAEIVDMHGKIGVWSHKLQMFFKFEAYAVANLSTPLEIAAERLVGSVEYPDRAGKRTATFANVKHGLQCLFREIGFAPRLNLATGYRDDASDLPPVGALVDALTAIGCSGMVPATIESAIESIASENAYDPWRDRMLSLPVWDRKPRLDTVFADVCGDVDSLALKLTGQLLFAALVRRQLQPGAPCPVVPVLMGPQRSGKSQFVATLAAALDLPKPTSLAFSHDRDMSMNAARSPVAELAEMAGLVRREAAEIKRWVTDDVDSYRAPYARAFAEHPRRFVLIGTSNKHETNNDETGNRRFMPVMIGAAHGQKIDDKRTDPLPFSIAQDVWHAQVPQLLAEAKARFADDARAYEQLVREAEDAVYAHNQAAMQRGEGLPQSSMTEYGPNAVRKLAAQHPDRRVYVDELADHIAARPGARSIQSRHVTAWVNSLGWAAPRSNGRRYFVPPADFLKGDSPDAADDATGAPPLLGLCDQGGRTCP